jgi:hypothetical protein
MANKAMCVGVDAVLSWFEENCEEDAPIYSVWQGNNLLFSYKDTDYTKAVEKLQANISSAANSGFNDMLMLKIHPNLKEERNYKNAMYITKTTPIIATLFFRCCETNGGGSLFPVGRNEYAPPMPNVPNVVLDKLNGIESRLTAIEEQEYDEEPTPPQQEQPTTLAGIANHLLNQPKVQEGLINMLTNMVSRFMPIQNQQSPVIGNIPNIMDEQQIETLINAINVIKQVRPQVINDLVNLANIAQTDPNKCNLILSMLPK